MRHRTPITFKRGDKLCRWPFDGPIALDHSINPSKVDQDNLYHALSGTNYSSPDEAVLYFNFFFHDMIVLPVRKVSCKLAVHMTKISNIRTTSTDWPASARTCGTRPLLQLASCSKQYALHSTSTSYCRG